MDGLPSELCLKIFHLLDHQSLATALQVCRKWNVLASENVIWNSLFKKRWGEDRATFYTPTDLKSWKDVYIVQDRCDRYGLGLKIIREGIDYYLIYQGEIQRCLGQDRHKNASNERATVRDEEQQQSNIADKILFFLGDLETACTNAKRLRF